MQLKSQRVFFFFSLVLFFLGGGGGGACRYVSGTQNILVFSILFIIFIISVIVLNIFPKSDTYKVMQVIHK